MTKRTLMAVFAHPDDEAFGTGGTLAKYAAEGCDVYLVTATRGEAGKIAESDLATTANLPSRSSAARKRWVKVGRISPTMPSMSRVNRKKGAGSRRKWPISKVFSGSYLPVA